MSELSEPNVERLLAAFDRKTHDRVPHFDFIDPGNVAAILGRPREQCPRNDGLSGPDAVTVARRTCMDFVLTSLQYWPGAVDDNGGVCKVNSWDDLERVRPIRSAEEDWARQRVRGLLDARQGTQIGVGVDVAGPFFSSYMAMGPVPIQSFLLTLYEDPALAIRLMDIQVERQIQIIEAVKGLPIDFVEIADDVCDNKGFMVDASLMEALWAPRFEKVLRAAQALGVPVICHCCGRLDQVLSKLVAWGVKGVTPLQPNCNDIYAIKKAWGDQLCLIGNIDIQGVLPFGTPDDVRADVKQHIDALARRGGYVVASSHSIVDAIPHENYMAMVEATVAYGCY